MNRTLVILIVLPQDLEKGLERYQIHKLRAIVDKSQRSIMLLSEEVINPPFVEYHAVTK